MPLPNGGMRRSPKLFLWCTITGRSWPDFLCLKFLGKVIIFILPPRERLPWRRGSVYGLASGKAVSKTFFWIAVAMAAAECRVSKLDAKTALLRVFKNSDINKLVYRMAIN
jgi:hypothetical protein